MFTQQLAITGLISTIYIILLWLLPTYFYCSVLQYPGKHHILVPRNGVSFIQYCGLVIKSHTHTHTHTQAIRRAQHSSRVRRLPGRAAHFGQSLCEKTEGSTKAKLTLLLVACYVISAKLASLTTGFEELCVWAGQLGSHIIPEDTPRAVL